MKQRISKRYIKAAVLSGVLALIIGLACSLLIHNLGNMIELLGEKLGLGTDTVTYVQIFDQLKTAEIDLPSVMLLLLSMVLVVGTARVLGGKEGKVISKKSRSARMVAAFLVACIGLILIMLMTLWFTDVNGIRFGTVVRFLYNALQSGVF